MPREPALQRDTGGATSRILATAAILVALAANRPVLDNYFLGDDFKHLLDLTTFGVATFIPQTFAGHMYLVRNTVFALHFALFDMAPAGYFATALVTHLVNVGLVFMIVRRLGADALVASLGAVLFGVAPMNEGVLGWYSVYGHALATFWTLVALWAVVRDGDAARPLGVRPALAAGACMLAASQSFGTGTAAALVFPVVVALLRPATWRAPVPAAIVAAVPAVVGVALWEFFWTPGGESPIPGVSMTAMLVGVLRTAAGPAGPARMLWHLGRIALVTLIAGHAYPLGRYPDPISAAVFAASTASLLLAFHRATWPGRRAMLALLLTACAALVSVAFARAGLWAAVRPPEALPHVYAGVKRYHYLAQAVLAILVALVAGQLRPQATPARRIAGAAIAAWAMWNAASAMLLAPPIDHHDRERENFTRASAAIDAAIRRHPPGSTACVPNGDVALFPGFPGWAGVFMLAHRTDELDARRVLFVTPDRALVAGTRGRLARLLRTPDACP